MTDFNLEHVVVHIDHDGEVIVEAELRNSLDGSRITYPLVLDAAALATLADDIQTVVLTKLTGAPPEDDGGLRTWGRTAREGAGR